MDFPGLLAAADRSLRGRLGGPVLYTPATGPAIPLVGIFDAAYHWVAAGEPGVSSSAPAVFLSMADLPADPRVAPPASIAVNGVIYAPKEIEPDGLGGVVIGLHQVSL